MLKKFFDMKQEAPILLGSFDGHCVQGTLPLTLLLRHHMLSLLH